MIKIFLLRLNTHLTYSKNKNIEEENVSYYNLIFNSFDKPQNWQSEFILYFLMPHIKMSYSYGNCPTPYLQRQCPATTLQNTYNLYFVWTWEHENMRKQVVRNIYWDQCFHHISKYWQFYTIITFYSKQLYEYFQ